MAGVLCVQIQPPIPRAHPYQDLREGVGQEGQEEGRDGFPGLEAQKSVSKACQTQKCLWD